MPQYYQVTPADYSVSASEGTVSFEVTNEGGGILEWSAGSEESWLGIEDVASGTGAGTIQVAYSENTSASSRMGTVTISSGNAENSPVSVTITQKAPEGDVICNSILLSRLEPNQHPGRGIRAITW
ncbi:MAG: BACON domain-containing protein [Balneolaceae bacterium]|nr:BACON domain-containing protein [Balneolaceae bacterium]